VGDDALPPPPLPPPPPPLSSWQILSRVKYNDRNEFNAHRSWTA
jgi:hypothetical protein